MRTRTRYERELVAELRRKGMVAFRLPASGSRDELALDVVAWDPRSRDLYVFEVKSVKDERDAFKLVSEHEAEKMAKLAEMGVKVVLAVRLINKKEWVFYELSPRSARRGA